MTSSRPRGRRPGRVETRGQILASALKLFSEIGYEKVSLRAIARDADVDPALIHHDFPSKAELFAESVLAVPVQDPAVVVAYILSGPRESVGERALIKIMEVWDVPSSQERFVAMLRAAVSETGARRPLSEYLACEVYTKVAESLGHKDAKRRGELAVTVLIGFTLSRDLLEFPTLSKMNKTTLLETLAKPLQTYLADPW